MKSLKLPSLKTTLSSFNDTALTLASETLMVPPELLTALRTVPVLTLSGGSGSGKTTWCQHLAKCFQNDPMMGNAVFKFCRKNQNDASFLIGDFHGTLPRFTELARLATLAARFPERPFFFVIEGSHISDLEPLLSEFFDLIPQPGREALPLIPAVEFELDRTWQAIRFQEIFGSSIEGLSFKEKIQRHGLQLPKNLFTIINYTTDSEFTEPPEFLRKHTWHWFYQPESALPERQTLNAAVLTGTAENPTEVVDPEIHFAELLISPRQRTRMAQFCQNHGKMPKLAHLETLLSL